MPRPARVVVISLEGLGCDHHRLVMIWAIKSSRDFARRGGVVGGPGFAAAFTGTALANCGAAAGFSNRAGMARSALCVAGTNARRVSSTVDRVNWEGRGQERDEEDSFLFYFSKEVCVASQPVYDVIVVGSGAAGGIAQSKSVLPCPMPFAVAADIAVFADEPLAFALDAAAHAAGRRMRR